LARQASQKRAIFGPLLLARAVLPAVVRMLPAISRVGGALLLNRGRDRAGNFG